MEFIVAVWLLSGIVCAYIATQKHRSGLGWFILGVIGGLFAIIAIAAVPSQRG